MQYTDSIREPDLLCYQLSYWHSYDPELVWSLVQLHGGSLSYLNGGQYAFYIPCQYAVLLVIAFPQLQRQPQKDLYT